MNVPHKFWMLIGAVALALFIAGGSYLFAAAFTGG